MPPSGAPRKDPLISAIVSLFIPGLGQIINGQVKKGLIILVSWIILWAVLVVILLSGSFILNAFTGFVGCLCCFGFVIPFIMNLYAAYDAHKTATQINNGVVVEDWLS